MGLLTGARCGCKITAEKKKGKYIYYRCTGFKGACGNSYIREELLADLLGDTIAPIQITPEMAAGIAEALRTSDADVEQRRTEAIRQLEQRRRAVTRKLDRGYDDFVAGHISEESWTRKSREWEADLRAAEGELGRIEHHRSRFRQPLKRS
jgi:site-specific DNA recombinase